MTKRRQKGEGSITTLKNGKVRIRVEVDPVDGKRKWLSAVADTKAEAIKKLREIQKGVETVKKVEAYHNTFGDYVEPYINVRRGDGVKETSLQTIRTHLQAAAECFGYLPITQITANHTNMLYQFFKDKGNSENTISMKIKVIRLMFEWLKFKMLIQEVPFGVFKKSNSQKVTTKKDLEVLSSEEHKELIKLMKVYFDMFLKGYHWTLTYRFLPVYMLTYETGMREGEIAGLKWSSVNFTNNTVTVNNQSVVLRGKGVLDSTLKTGYGYRTIHISQTTMSVLKQLKERCEATGFYSEYVFGNRNKKGRSYTPVMFLHTFKQYLWDIGVRRNFTFHDIRHTNASIMFDKKVDVNVITKRLGHSSINTTLKVYTHVLQECEDQNKAVVIA